MRRFTLLACSGVLRTMRVSEIRVLLLLLSSVQCLCVCPSLPTGSTSCSDINPPFNHPNTQGAPASDGSCGFDSSFCKYIQGCTDPVASEWTSQESYAQVRGTTGLFEQYSVLQSPSLRIDHVTCFKISGAVYNPSALSVYFGEELSNACPVISQIAPGVNETFDKAVNIHPATGKVFFRARSGGNVNGYVRLHSVSLTTGRCEDPHCRFGDVDKDQACDFWEWNGWNVTFVTNQGYMAALGPGLTAGTLKTDLLMATGNEEVCLQFRYRMTGINVTLAVSVQHEDGVTELLWQVTNHDESGFSPYATAPLRSDNAFFIIFQGQRCHTWESKDIAIDDVEVVRTSPCSYQPQGSKPSGQQLTSTLDPSCNPLPRITTPATTTSAHNEMPKISTSVQVTEREASATTIADIHMPTSMSHDSSLTGPTEDYDSVPVIMGVIAGVVVLAVVGVVLAVVIWRKRKRNGEGPKHDKLNSTFGSADIGNSMSPGPSTVASNRGDHLYVTSTAVDAESRTDAAYINPYEVAENDAPGKSRFSPNDEYNVLNSHDSGHKLPKPHDFSEEHYSHINSGQPSVLYSQVQKTTKRDVTEHGRSGHQGSSGPDCKPHLGVVYNQVQNKGKSAASAVVSDPGAEYSQVQKKGNKHDVAVKPTIAEKPVVSDDYNRIDLSEKRADAKAVDGVQDTYSRLNNF